MVLQMSRPWKHPATGIYWFRRRVPSSLKALVGKTEEKFSLGTRDPTEAKRLHAEAAVEVERRWANLSAPVITISEREATELARPIYDGFIAAYRENPSEQRLWHIQLGGALFSPLPNVSDLKSISADDFRRGQMRDLVEHNASEVLKITGRRLDETGMARLRQAVANAFQAGAKALSSVHDFSLVPTVGVASRQGAGSSSATVTFASLVDGWALEKKPKAKTEYSFRRVLAELAREVGFDDASKLTIQDLIAWKERMLARGLSPRTIRFNKIAAVSAVLRWGADNLKIKENVAAKVVVAGAGEKKAGTGRRGYTDDEARVVLAAAAGEAGAKRWVPLLCAYSGARISEICQLRKKDVVQVDGVWAIKLEAEAGSLKNAGSERLVPLHPKVVQAGFLDFVAGKADGVIFTDIAPDRFGSRGGNGTKVIGRWVRELGITDERISPSHSWRHRLKTLARRHGLPLDITNAITGHVASTTADVYGEYELRALHREISKLP